MGPLGRRGTLTSPLDRTLIIELVEEAIASGATQIKACAEIGLSARTYQRWNNPVSSKEDQRPLAKRPEPRNKLTTEEKESILTIVNKPENASKPPSLIVPALADEGIYLASESSFYRVMHNKNQQNHRGHSKKREKRPIARHLATGPNQVWTWDITYLSGPIKGLYYYLWLGGQKPSNNPL